MRKGFTLIEVLISAALLGLIGLMLMTTLNTTTTLKKRLEKKSERIHLARQALARMTREISMAYVSGHQHPSNPVVETHFIGDGDRLSFVAFGHVVHQPGLKQSDQREITYVIQTDQKTGENALYRKEKINLSKNTGKTGYAQILCPFTEAIEFAYFDDDLGTWQSDWKTEGAASKLTLPSRVRIKMTVKMENGEDLVLWSQASIWLTKRIKIQ